MKLLTRTGIVFCMAGIFCYAENWNGKLLDASCYDNSQTSASKASGGKLDKTCAPTASTTGFAVQVGKNKVYKLDSAGNAKVAEALQAGSIKADNDGDVHVSVSGSMQGDTVKVDSVQGKTEHR